VDKTIPTGRAVPKQIVISQVRLPKEKKNVAKLKCFAFVKK